MPWWRSARWSSRRARAPLIVAAAGPRGRGRRGGTQSGRGGCGAPPAALARLCSCQWQRDPQITKAVREAERKEKEAEEQGGPEEAEAEAEESSDGDVDDEDEAV